VDTGGRARHVVGTTDCSGTWRAGSHPPRDGSPNDALCSQTVDGLSMCAAVICLIFALLAFKYALNEQVLELKQWQTTSCILFEV